jgi:hypothetical protein
MNWARSKPSCVQSKLLLAKLSCSVYWIDLARNIDTTREEMDDPALTIVMFQAKEADSR